MNKSPVIFLDDDPDELIIVQEAMNALKLERQALYFDDSKQLIEYLRSKKLVPFIIICDVRLTTETGFDVKKLIEENFGLTNQSIPFIFWSSFALPPQSQKLFDLSSQGFFIKPSAFDELCDILELIIKYWEHSKHPLEVK